jgi:hypothetical protein
VSEQLGVTLAGGGAPDGGADRRWPYTTLRTSVFDEVFTYGIEATWLTYFAHLGRTAGNDGGWCGWGGSVQTRCRCWRAQGLLRLN